MQTGYYPHNVGFPDYGNGHHLREDIPTIAEVLSAAGYRTAHIGKWHLNGTALSPGNRYVPSAYHRGYAEWLGYEHGENYFESVHYGRDDTPIMPPDNQYETDFQTDRALQFIESNTHRPWMMHLSWGPPHFPLAADNVPAEALAAFDMHALQLRDNVPAGGLTDAQRQELTVYYAMISTLDRNLGRLLDRLDVLGLSETTIIVFTSDHGDMLYSHANIYKRRPLEESSRIPFLLCYPGVVPPGQVSEEPMSLVDLPGSLTGLMGLEPMQTEGMSFVAHWKGAAPVGPRDAVFMGCQWLGCRPAGGNHVKRPWRAVRTRSHMACWLQHEAGSRLVHLFDLSQDPFQLNDLRHDVSQAGPVAELRGILSDHLTRTRDPFPL
jgi:arylsulfatase A-like enzyme